MGKHRHDRHRPAKKRTEYWRKKKSEQRAAAEEFLQPAGLRQERREEKRSERAGDYGPFIGADAEGLFHPFTRKGVSRVRLSKAELLRSGLKLGPEVPTELASLASPAKAVGDLLSLVRLDLLPDPDLQAYALGLGLHFWALTFRIPRDLARLERKYFMLRLSEAIDDPWRLLEAMTYLIGHVFDPLRILGARLCFQFWQTGDPLLRGLVAQHPEFGALCKLRSTYQDGRPNLVVKDARATPGVPVRLRVEPALCFQLSLAGHVSHLSVREWPCTIGRMPLDAIYGRVRRLRHVTGSRACHGGLHSRV